MSINIDDLLKDCPEYQEWSNAIYSESLEHYENDPDYFSWVESVEDEEESNDHLLLDPLDDDDWEAVFIEWKLPLSVEEETFYETYCI